jgi:ketosteroid isomerase-like protein
MTHAQVQAWLDAYIAAWRSYDPDAIGDLFSVDVSYAYEPYAEPRRGRDAIVADWIGDRDEPGSWEAAYAPLVVEGDRAVATGETRYADGRTFSNIYALRFDGDGRCAELVEWYMQHPQDPPAD